MFSLELFAFATTDICPTFNACAGSQMQFKALTSVEFSQDCLFLLFSVFYFFHTSLLKYQLLVAVFVSEMLFRFCYSIFFFNLFFLRQISLWRSICRLLKPSAKLNLLNFFVHLLSLFLVISPCLFLLFRVILWIMNFMSRW